jgi:hypothetical protein
MSDKKLSSKRRTTGHLFPHDQTAYFFYRRHRKTDNPIGEHRTRFKEAVCEIFRAMSEVACDHEGGLWLDEYGYLAAVEVKYIRDKDTLHHNKTFVNDKIYTLQMFTDATKNSCIRYMSMDRSFSKYAKKCLYNMLQYDRKKPKIYYTLLKKLKTGK